LTTAPAYRTFSDLFIQATGYEPFPYQVSLATDRDLPYVLNIPTGLGKTAAVIAAWLWRRRFHPDLDVRQAAPRRLVYCLPTRVLVEQTAENAKEMLRRLGLLAVQPSDLDGVSVYSLVGGDLEDDWDLYPEAEAILVGTQDMLLSRALNRGYAMSRYRWPIQFGLINNDVLWIMDEVQLMGAGLATTTQLQGFRDKMGTFGPSHSVWVSATVDLGNLQTVDSPLKATGVKTLQLQPGDLTHNVVQQRVYASKELRKARTRLGKDEKKYAASLANEVLHSHRIGSLTIVIVNQVSRAQGVYQALRKALTDQKFPAADWPELLLIHSRFRRHERQKKNEELHRPLRETGRIVVATQAIEAGVDISAKTLFTELAPWPSLVQRFGRCNRYGEYGSGRIETLPSRDFPEPDCRYGPYGGGDRAQVFWIDIESTSDQAENSGRTAASKLSLPYSMDELNWARAALEGLRDVGPHALRSITYPGAEQLGHVIRQKDLIELFDTSPDLSGFDLDISRFVRETDEHDIQVFWRQWEGDSPPSGGPSPDELCPVGLYDLKEFLKKGAAIAWYWDGLEGTWLPVPADQIFAGMTLLLPVEAGGYDPEIGWTAEPTDRPKILPHSEVIPDSMDDDHGSQAKTFEELVEHTDKVVGQINHLQHHLSMTKPTPPWAELVLGARWHDAGKVHPAFQNAITESLPLEDPRRQGGPWAKGGIGGAKGNYWVADQAGNRVKRQHFRHELASALAALANGVNDLVVYLAAAHHGKVRLLIRSLPGEQAPIGIRRFARGVWDGDELPATDLGGGVNMPKTVLDLACMEMGANDRGPSWLERAIRLRDSYGPLRLAYLEALLRIADWRASRE